MAFGLFTGCEENTDIGTRIQFNCGDIGNFSTEELFSHPIVTKLVKSAEELQSFCDESGIIYKGEKYDEAFFSDKALLIYFFNNASTMISIHIDSLTVNNETLTINITRRFPRAGYIDVVENRSYAFEINQGDVTNVDNIHVSQKDKYK